MAIHDNSRNLLTDVVAPISPVTGKATRPAFVDLRERIQDFAADDRAAQGDSSTTLVLMARSKLGDAEGWWVIADLNGILDPFQPVQPGVRYRVPSAGRYQLDILPSDRSVPRRTT